MNYNYEYVLGTLIIILITSLMILTIQALAKYIGTLKFVNTGMFIITLIIIILGFFIKEKCL